MNLSDIQPIRCRAAFVAAAVIVLAACTGDDGDDRDDPPGPDPSIAVPSVTAEVVDGVPRLEWEAVDGAVAYRISSASGSGGEDGEDVSASGTDVPADICAEGTCSLSLMAGGLDLDGETTVSAVTEDGTYSEPATVAVDLPEPDSEPAEIDEQNLEVLLVYGWNLDEDAPYDPDAPPLTEVVPVESLEEAQRVIEEAQQPGTGVISASLNLPADATGDGGGDGEDEGDLYDEYLARGTWQVEEMGYDQLPGDPPGDGVVIATIEQSGVDASHPSLAGAVEDGYHVGGDGDGLVDPGVHATGVASLMVGQPAGAVPGIAPGATVYPINMGESREDDLHEAIVHAVDAGADIINVSQVLGCSSFLVITSCPTGLKAATDYAEENGVVVVAGAGNNGGAESCDGTPDEELWPAVLETVVSVGAYEPSREVWECTPNRPDVDLLAPGVDLFIADAGGSYALADGTSFAAPLVSGLIAVVLAERPDLSPEAIREMLPQWRRADGQLSVYAALVSAGIIETDEFEPPEGEDLAAVYPYRVELSFDESHEIVPYIEAVDELSMTEGISLTSITRDYAYDNPEYGQDGYEFGEIAGLIFLHDDGSASATGWMQPRPRWAGEHEGYLSVHWEMCTIVPSFTSAAGRMYRWDIPVTVEAALVSDTGGDGESPQVELGFSLGIGATMDEPGELPPVTIHSDDLDRCADLNERFDEEAYLHSVGWRPWPEVEPFVGEHYAAVEQAHEQLIAATPLTLDVPVALDGSDQETTAAGDPDVSITVSTD
ncbi:S8 family peptidase [Jiangella asiatica]|uniref:Peptidase S8/S53 domain-containing protein n=1 Tax=Jiangella asiatica TaxID=2530372 RepID=A0A4R5DDH0_9ACTN|nr:S8 family serine peptidase [Jiangella asiatica]TDE11809.1 hypothetical protein E1269_08580 [Jiangella asiatica]